MKMLITFLIISSCQNIFAQSYTQQFDEAAKAHAQLTYSESWLGTQVENYLERHLQDGLRDDVEVVDGDIEILNLEKNKYKIEFSFLARRKYNSRHESICRATFVASVVRTQDSFRLAAPYRLDPKNIDCYRN